MQVGEQAAVMLYCADKERFHSCFFAFFYALSILWKTSTANYYYYYHCYYYHHYYYCYCYHNYYKC